MIRCFSDEPTLLDTGVRNAIYATHGPAKVAAYRGVADDRDVRGVLAAAARAFVVIPDQAGRSDPSNFMSLVPQTRDRRTKAEIAVIETAIYDTLAADHPMTVRERDSGTWPNPRSPRPAAILSSFPHISGAARNGILAE